MFLTNRNDCRSWDRANNGRRRDDGSRQSRNRSYGSRQSRKRDYSSRRCRGLRSNISIKFACQSYPQLTVVIVEAGIVLTTVVGTTMVMGRVETEMIEAVNVVVDAGLIVEAGIVLTIVVGETMVVGTVEIEVIVVDVVVVRVLSDVTVDAGCTEVVVTVDVVPDCVVTKV
nr:hypothetical protein CFP56_21678 [Quercus suber]